MSGTLNHTRQRRRLRHAHPQAEIIESLPGLGPILGTEFLVATGGDLHDWILLPDGDVEGEGGKPGVPAQDASEGVSTSR